MGALLPFFVNLELKMTWKNQTVHCRVTEAEKLALEKISIREGLNLSEVNIVLEE